MYTYSSISQYSYIYVYLELPNTTFFREMSIYSGFLMVMQEFSGIDMKNLVICIFGYIHGLSWVTINIYEDYGDCSGINLIRLKWNL